MVSTKFGEFLMWERASRDTIDFKKTYVDMADDLVAGLMLSQIMYWFLPNRDGNPKATIQRDGHTWIAKHNEDWWEECRIHRGAAVRALDILRKKNLIETAIFKFGGAPTIHIRILEDEFMEAWESAVKNPIYRIPVNGNTGFQQIDLPDSGKTYTESTAKTTTKSERTRRSSPVPVVEAVGFPIDGTKPPPEKRFHQRCAEILYNGLAKHRKIMSNEPPDLKDWAETFRLFTVRSNVSPDELEINIVWYASDGVTMITTDFVPSACCADEFCKKFVRIDEARGRVLASREREAKRNGHTTTDNEQKVELPAFRDLAPTGSYDDYLKQTGD